MRSKKERFTGSLVILLLAIAFVTGGMWGGIVGGGMILWVLGPNSTPDPAEIVHISPAEPLSLPTAVPLAHPSPTPTSVMISRTDASVEDAVEGVLASVVTVINYQDGYTSQQSTENRRIVGSGIIVDERGYIVTNAHVIEDFRQVNIILANGREITTRVIIQNSNLDLAMLKVEAASIPLTAAPWGDSSLVRLGQPVVAIGSALGDFPNSVTMGIVSGLNRALALNDYVVHGLIQTDAAINQGNSGGPLVNLDGQVVGITTFMIREDHNKGVAQGIGFAIPASSVKALVGQWIAEEASRAAPPLNVEAGGAPTNNSE